MTVAEKKIATRQTLVTIGLCCAVAVLCTAAAIYQFRQDNIAVGVGLTVLVLPVDVFGMVACIRLLALPREPQ